MEAERVKDIEEVSRRQGGNVGSKGEKSRI